MNIPTNNDTFVELVIGVVRKVERGEKVVVHCKAGKGRTGISPSLWSVFVESHCCWSCTARLVYCWCLLWHVTCCWKCIGSTLWSEFTNLKCRPFSCMLLSAFRNAAKKSYWVGAADTSRNNTNMGTREICYDLSEDYNWTSTKLAVFRYYLSYCIKVCTAGAPSLWMLFCSEGDMAVATIVVWLRIAGIC